MITGGDMKGKFVNYIECGGYHNGAVTDDGSLVMWGRSDVGQIGLKKDELVKDDMGYVRTIPSLVDYFGSNGKKVKQIALGEAHTLALDHNGHVYSFGWGDLG